VKRLLLAKNKEALALEEGNALRELVRAADFEPPGRLVEDIRDQGAQHQSRLAADGGEQRP
jgi:hypothetical protein